MRGASKLRRLAVLALVVCLAFQPAIGGAMAAPDGGDDWGEGGNCFFRSLMTLSGTAGVIEPCQTPAEDDTETRADLYAGGLEAKDLGDHVTTIQNNHLNKTRTTCWCKIKADVIAGIKNNSTKAEVLANVNQTVRDHYAGVQWNILEAYKSQTNYLIYLSNVSTEQGFQPTALGSQNGAGVFRIDTINDGLQGGTLNHEYAFEEAQIGEYSNGTVINYNATKDLNTTDGSIVLLNNETRAYPSFLVWSSNDGSTYARDLYDPFITLGNNSYNVSQINDKFVDNDGSVENSQEPIWMQRFNVTTFSDDPADNVKIVDPQDWRSAMRQTFQQHDQMKANAKQYVDAVWNTYNATDFETIDPNVLHSTCSMVTQATDFESTGYYAYARSELALLSYNGSVNESMSIRYNPADESGKFRSSTGANITFQTAGTGHGAHVAPNETIPVNVSTTDGSIESVDVTVSDLEGDVLGNISAANATGNRWEFNLSSINDSVPDGERVSLNVTATATNSTFSVDNWQLVVDGPAGREGELMSGAIMTDWRPASTNGTLVVNTTYNTSNAGPSVIMLDQVSSNRTQTVELEGEFVITSMTNVATGEDVNSTTLEDQTQQTNNASLTVEEVLRILEYRNQHNQNFDLGGGGGGGGGGFNFDFGMAGLGFIVIAGGGLLLASNLMN